MISAFVIASKPTFTARTLCRAVCVYLQTMCMRTFVAGFVCVCALLVSGCDMEWESRANGLYEDAKFQQESGQYDQSYRLYTEALRTNPYHVLANRMMGQLLERSYRQEAQAIYYYNRYLDLQPDMPDDVKEVRERIELLQQILDGTLEDPEYAAQDMIWAAINDGNRMWLERLHPTLLAKYPGTDGAQKYRQLWKQVFSSGEVFVIKRTLFSGGNAALNLQLKMPSGKSRYFRIRMMLPQDKKTQKNVRSMWEMVKVEELSAQDAY